MSVAAPPELLHRIHQFALNSIRFYKKLPPSALAQVPGVQFLRASTAVEANYRAAKRGRSKAEFIAKLGIVVEEIDESVGWLELMRDGGITTEESLLSEALELRKILGKSGSRASKCRRNEKSHARSSSLVP